MKIYAVLSIYPPIKTDASALWLYPHVNVSIRDLSQILTTAPIFLTVISSPIPILYIAVPRLSVDGMLR